MRTKSPCIKMKRNQITERIIIKELQRGIYKRTYGFRSFPIYIGTHCIVRTRKMWKIKTKFQGKLNLANFFGKLKFNLSHLC